MINFPQETYLTCLLVTALGSIVLVLLWVATQVNRRRSSHQTQNGYHDNACADICPCCYAAGCCRACSGCCDCCSKSTVEMEITEIAQALSSHPSNMSISEGIDLMVEVRRLEDCINMLFETYSELESRLMTAPSLEMDHVLLTIMYEKVEYWLTSGVAPNWEDIQSIRSQLDQIHRRFIKQKSRAQREVRRSSSHTASLPPDLPTLDEVAFQTLTSPNSQTSIASSTCQSSVQQHQSSSRENSNNRRHSRRQRSSRRQGHSRDHRSHGNHQHHHRHHHRSRQSRRPRQSSTTPSEYNDDYDAPIFVLPPYGNLDDSLRPPTDETGAPPTYEEATSTTV